MVRHIPQHTTTIITKSQIKHIFMKQTTTVLIIQCDYYKVSRGTKRPYDLFLIDLTWLKDDYSWADSEDPWDSNLAGVFSAMSSNSSS
jgi:hypothetical protein